MHFSPRSNRRYKSFTGETFSCILHYTMERSARLFSAAFVLLMLLVATDMGPTVTEARKCETQSHKFKGTCLSETNCASVCQTEGFSGGDCRGLRRRCFCTKQC